MKVAGVIVEYNPMHNGHVYHLQKTRELYQADAIIAVMSGHFLQRGEPAIAGPWYRARMALASGADLVFELPVLFSTSSAETFAYGAVSLLDRLGVVDQLSFGSEAGDISLLAELAAFLLAPPPAFLTSVNRFLKLGHSHPKAHAAALSDWFQDKLQPLWDQPNNMLGMEYIKALLRLDSRIQPVTVARYAAGFHAENFQHPEIASATAIRKSILQGDMGALSCYMPAVNRDLFDQALSCGDAPITWDSFLPALHILLLRETKESIRQYAHLDEGLGERILSVFRTHLSPNMSGCIRQIKTRRFTWTHIQRALTAILLGISKEEAKSAGSLGAGYARVLGFNQRGQELLRQIRQQGAIPVVSKIGQSMPAEMALDLRAQHIYQSVTRKQTKMAFPVRVQSEGSDADAG